MGVDTGNQTEIVVFDATMLMCVDECAYFDGAFFGLFAEPGKIESVGILEGFAGEIGLRLGKSEVEVGDCFTLPL